jgi:hypothetical protein
LEETFSQPIKSIDPFSQPIKSLDPFSKPIKSLEILDLEEPFSQPIKSVDPFSKPIKSLEISDLEEPFSQPIKSVERNNFFQKKFQNFLSKNTQKTGNLSPPPPPLIVNETESISANSKIEYFLFVSKFRIPLTEHI